MPKVVVVGMGYVGIPAAALFADAEGFKVVGVQRRSKRSGWKIDMLNEGKNPIGGDEPGLDDLINRVVNEKGSFSVTDDISTCGDADAILLDVQTPTDADRVPRYESLREVCHNVGENMKPGVLVVIESTVAPGTTINIAKPILEKASGMKAGEDFYLAFSYERVMVGRLIHNIVNLPRICGGIDDKSTKLAVDLYSNIVKAELFPTDALTAEISKVVENTYRDVNIAFANEVALICESLGVDSFEVRKLVNTLPNDPSNPAANPVRNMHFPGAGVGGHCLPKDPWLLKYGLDEYGTKAVNPEIIVNSRLLNDRMPIHTVDILESTMIKAGIGLQGAKIAVLGVAFLENSDDTRNTPSLTVYDELVERGAEPMLHDPLVRDFERPFSDDLDAVLKDAKAVVLVTSHREYADIDLQDLKTKMQGNVIVDGRNFLSGTKAEEAGFEYRCIGKGK